MAATNRAVVGESITFMIRDDLGDIAQEYASWLQTTQRCKFSTIANYINGLVSITSYCYANLAPSDALLAMDPNPLTQLINLRGQAEKASKTQQMYDQRVGGWIEWPDVQKARVSVAKKLADMGDGGAPAAKRNLLRDCCALSLLSLIPPDRVGCIRKLRFGHTLKKKPGGGWMMDLTKARDGHKTSRFYGPFAASLPSELTPILDKYSQLFSLEVGGDEAYLFHPPQSGFDRPMESSSWSQWVGRLFNRHAGVTIAPKTLRSIFITWLRSSTDAPEILKSAAHAQKHSEARQASGDYDQQADDRLVKAAYDFNISFASTFTAESLAHGGASSSSTVASDPAEPTESAEQVQAAPAPAPPPAALPGMPLEQQPEPPHVGSVMLPPLPQAELYAQLADVGFSKSKAKGNGDCYPLSVMAGFEISAAAARQPKAGTTARVIEVREGAVGILTGDVAIDGIGCAVFREGEDLPSDSTAALEAMAPWTRRGFWNSGDGHKFASFMLGVALHLERPVAVIQRKGKNFIDPVRVYGARNAAGALLHSIAKPHAPETIPTFRLVHFADLIEALRCNPIAISVIEWNGSNHFDPWILKPRSVLRAAIQTVAVHGAAHDAEDSECEGDDDDGQQAVAGEAALGGAIDGEQKAADAEDVAGESATVSDALSQEQVACGNEDAGGELAAGSDDEPALPQWVLEHAGRGAASTRSAGLLEALRSNEPPLGDDDEMDGGVLSPRPPPPPPPPPPAAQPPSRSQRDRKRKQVYGDNGELDGCASSFRSAPPPRKPSVDPSVEMGVPAYALPGEQVWAMGLHAGARKRFKAEVISLRKQFPRIVVKYVATEHNETSAIALPEMRTAYLTMADVEAKDW